MSAGVIVLLVVVGSTVWVGVDASKRDFGEGKSGAGTWVVGCLLLWIIVFPIYLARRGRAPLKDAPATAAATVQTGALAYRECPHCREAMRRDASVCPHCRHPSPAWTWHEGRWWFRASESEPWEWFSESSGVWTPMEPTSPTRV